MAQIGDQREEMVSARKLSAMEIICQLLVTYQPGGLAEKELLLRSLEMPVIGSVVDRRGRSWVEEVVPMEEKGHRLGGE